jgi:hypothetical protein
VTSSHATAALRRRAIDLNVNRQNTYSRYLVDDALVSQGDVSQSAALSGERNQKDTSEIFQKGEILFKNRELMDKLVKSEETGVTGVKIKAFQPASKRNG